MTLFYLAAVAASTLSSLTLASPLSGHHGLHHARQAATVDVADCSLPATNLATFVPSTPADAPPFQLLCASDFPGGDYAAADGVASFAACVALCAADGRCAAVAYARGPQACYLKDVAAPPTPNGGVDGARKLPGTGPDASPARAGCVDAAAADGATFTAAGGGDFMIMCGVDFAGGDVAAQETADFEACVEACAARDDCVDVSFDYRARVCYLKGRLVEAAPSPAAGIWTAKKVLATPPAQPPSCDAAGASDGQTYNAGGGDASFVVACGVDYGGGDLSAAAASTFARCLDLCAAAAGCVGASYAGGQCYMKRRLTDAPAAAAWVWSARLVVAAPGPDPIAVAPVSPGCGDGGVLVDGATYTAASGDAYMVECGVDYAGGDLRAIDAASFAACIEACDAADGCVDVSYVGPACYLKNRVADRAEPNQAAWVSTALKVRRPEQAAQVSCIGGADDGTVHDTGGGNRYEIRCGVEYAAGDMGMVFTDTFNACMDACDAAEGCVVVSYSGAACYMKNVVGELVQAGAVWNARYVGKTPVTTSSSATATTSVSSTAMTSSSVATTSSASSSTATNTFSVSISGTSASTSASCASAEPTWLPERDPNVDGSDVERFTPSRALVLSYASPGSNRVMQLSVALNVDGVLLEDSSRIASVRCAAGADANSSSLALAFTSVANRASALAAWSRFPALLLVTLDPSCNGAGARGLYLVNTTQREAVDDGVLLTFTAAVEKNMANIAAGDMTLTYGTVTDGQDTFTSTSTGAQPSQPTAASAASDCAASTGSATASSSTASSEPTARPRVFTIAELTPGARVLYDFLSTAANTSANGTLDWYFPPSNGSTQLAPLPPLSPDDVAAVQAELLAMGLSDPAALVDDVTASIALAAQGVCETTPAGQKLKRQLLAARPAIRPRDWADDTTYWDDELKVFGGPPPPEDNDAADLIGEAVCSDTASGIVGGLVGAVAGYYFGAGVGEAAGEVAETAMEAACLGKDMYDSRDAFTCLIGLCDPPPTIQQAKYTFAPSWWVDFWTFNDKKLRWFNDANALSCATCSYQVRNVQFDGTIVIWTQGDKLSLRQADIVPAYQADLDLIFRLQTDSSFVERWSSALATQNFGAIAFDKIFNIHPRLVGAMGVTAIALAPVDVTAGARISWAPRSDFFLDMRQRRYKDPSNWMPKVTIVNPVLRAPGKVSITPWFQWAVELDVQIFGLLQMRPSIATEVAVGIDSTFMTGSAADSCPPGQLNVNTYVKARSYLLYGDGKASTLYDDKVASANQCFPAPALVPSPDQVAALGLVAGGYEYCASRVGYAVPTVVATVTTTSVASTTATATASTTLLVTVTTTVTETTTTSYTTWSAWTRPAVVTMVGGAPTTTNSWLAWKRDGGGPAAPTAAVETGSAEQMMELARRADALLAPVHAAELAARAAAALPMPTMLLGWDADRVVYACKQVVSAAGRRTVTRTYTATATSTTTLATVTSTITTTRNLNGPLVTSTKTISSSMYMGLTTPYTAPTTTSTYTTAPLPSVSGMPAASCFEIRAHGVPQFDDDPAASSARVSFFGGSSGLGVDLHMMRTRTFFLSATGKLLSYTRDGAGAITWAVGVEGYMLTLGPAQAVIYPIYVPGGVPSTQFVPATCVRDAGDDPCNPVNRLICSVADKNGVRTGSLGVTDRRYSLHNPQFPENFPPAFSPYWGDGRHPQTNETLNPLWLEYIDVPCPLMSVGR